MRGGTRHPPRLYSARSCIRRLAQARGAPRRPSRRPPDRTEIARRRRERRGHTAGQGNPDHRRSHRGASAAARHRWRAEHRHLHPHPPDRSHDPRLRVRQHLGDQVGDHVHRRRPGHPALPRLPDRAARAEQHLPRGGVAAHLRRAADGGRARRLRRPDPPPHAAARGPQALLLVAAAHRAPDVGALVRGVGALDVLREPVRSEQPGARRAQHDPHAREAAGDRRLRAQEEHRPGLPLPGQRARVRRQLPQAELRRPQRAVRASIP